MKTRRQRVAQRMFAGSILGASILAVSLAAAQTAYTTKFPGDPAHSESEAAALGYIRTTARAQHVYKRTNQHYATSLTQLVHTGSFTRRMVQTDRGDYTVSFHSQKDGYELALTPKHIDADHRSFYSTEDGVIHADDQKTADAKSPVVK